MAKTSKTRPSESKDKSTEKTGLPSTSTGAFNPLWKWAPLLGLPIGALSAAQVWSFVGGTKWMLVLAMFIVGWRVMLQVANPNDPEAAS